jgi:hypothetical protein
MYVSSHLFHVTSNADEIGQVRKPQVLHQQVISSPSLSLGLSGLLMVDGRLKGRKEAIERYVSIMK